MIYQLKILQPTKTVVPWLGKVRALAQPCVFDFKPGINVIFGPNGAGKSSLLQLLGKHFHCQQGGRSAITQDSGYRHFEKTYDPNSIAVKHDGQSVVFFDASHVVGVMKGGSYFDYDFLEDSVINSVMARGSSGELVLRRLMLAINEGAKNPLVEWKIKKKDVNSIWKERLETIEAQLKKNAPKGPRTILLDEPDRSLDLPNQMALWRYIVQQATKYQIIVASHSSFSLNLPEVNYIDLMPGKMAESLRALAILPRWHKIVMEDLRSAKKKRKKKAK